MKRAIFGIGVAFAAVSCGSSDTNGTTAGSGGAAAASSASGASGDSAGAMGGAHETAGGVGGSVQSQAGAKPAAAAGAAGAGDVACDELATLVDAYSAAHQGQAGDINTKTPEELAADPDAQALLSLCGENQRPVIPRLAWEYGGADHAWINPQLSALAYCVYIPVATATAHWAYDKPQDTVTADVYVVCPEQNPCKNEPGADEVAACIGDPTNFEILVDTASFDDGADVGLILANASTDLNLIPAGGGDKLHLYTDP